MEDELPDAKPAALKSQVDHWKWLVGVLGGLMLTLQGFGWIEGRIEKRVEERVLTATSIARLDNSGKDTKTWMDGRINTLQAELDGLRRELSIIRGDLRSPAPAFRPAEAAPAAVTVPK